MHALPMPPEWVLQRLREGLVIPAHPLALTSKRQLDVTRQRALSRYYCAAGAGGLAIGVHTTQFEIRDPQYRLFHPVLELASETIGAFEKAAGQKIVRIAGICGTTRQALAEARLARELGYHAGLLSLAGVGDGRITRLIQHGRAVAQEIPLFGFYLQPAVGGTILPIEFWRKFASIANVIAIKIAPFNRYQTYEVVRAVAEAGRAQDIALYTGNDDHILIDLLTEYAIETTAGIQRMRINGGLLGHWAVWTKKAVELFKRCQQLRTKRNLPSEILTLAEQITDANAAFFDAAHQFAGCLAGIQDVLRRQGLLENNLCLDPSQKLSPGQAEEIDRVYSAYPHLNDDEFVAAHLDQWLR